MKRVYVSQLILYLANFDDIKFQRITKIWRVHVLLENDIGAFIREYMFTGLIRYIQFILLAFPSTQKQLSTLVTLDWTDKTQSVEINLYLLVIEERILSDKLILFLQLQNFTYITAHRHSVKYKAETMSVIMNCIYPNKCPGLLLYA